MLAQFAAGMISVGMLFAQAVPAPARGERLIGTVATVDVASRTLTITLDAGGQKRVIAAPEASLRRVAPGEKDLSKAVVISLAEIEAGDRVLVRGSQGQGDALLATSIIVVSKGDLARKHEAERAEWKRRGLVGKVSAINPEAREIAVATPARPAPATVIVRLAPNAAQRRYRPDSIRFSDAQPSTLADIKVGDQIHALGERAADGVFTAEQIVSGSFRNIAAIVTAVDAAQRMLSVKDVDGNKPVLVRLGADTILRTLPPEFAQRLGNGGNGHQRADSENRPAESHQAGAVTLDVQTIRDRMSPLPLESLQAGDVVIIASAASPSPEHMSAIVVLAGAEPLLTRSAAQQRELLGSWNLNSEPDLP